MTKKTTNSDSKVHTFLSGLVTKLQDNPQNTTWKPLAARAAQKADEVISSAREEKPPTLTYSPEVLEAIAKASSDKPWQECTTTERNAMMWTALQGLQAADKARGWTNK